jgi:hypothetical protein
MMRVLWVSPSSWEVCCSGFRAPPAKRFESLIGEQIAVSDEQIERHVLNPKRAQAKESLWRWAPVQVQGGYLALANFIGGHAVVVDVDDGTTLEQLIAAFDGLYVLTHSTFNATAQSPRWRVIVMLDRPTASVEQHDRVWRWLAAKIEAVGGRPEYGARDATHPWAVPAVPPSGHYVAHVLRGAFAEVDEALATIPNLNRYCGVRDESYADRLLRARRYLESVPGAIQGSNGSAKTFKATCTMVRGFQLNPDDALSLLVEVHNPLCKPEWSNRELAHKVRQALQHSRLTFGWLTDRRHRPRAA